MLTEEQLNIIDDVSSGMVILDGLNDAIIGYDSYTTRIIYDYDTIVSIFIQRGMTVEESIEYIDYNIINLHITNEDGVDISPIIFSRFSFDDSDS